MPSERLSSVERLVVCSLLSALCGLADRSLEVISDLYPLLYASHRCSYFSHVSSVCFSSLFYLSFTAPSKVFGAGVCCERYSIFVTLNYVFTVVSSCELAHAVMLVCVLRLLFTWFLDCCYWHSCVLLSVSFTGLSNCKAWYRDRSGISCCTLLVLVVVVVCVLVRLRGLLFVLSYPRCAD